MQAQEIELISLNRLSIHGANKFLHRQLSYAAVEEHNSERL